MLYRERRNLNSQHEKALRFLKLDQPFDDFLLVFVVFMLSLPRDLYCSISAVGSEILEEREITESGVPEGQQDPCDQGNACLQKV